MPKKTQHAASTEAVTTKTAGKLWEALQAHPGSTAAELADAAKIGRSTATKSLAAWHREALVTRSAPEIGGGKVEPYRWTVASNPEPPMEHADVPASSRPEGIAAHLVLMHGHDPVRVGVATKPADMKLVHAKAHADEQHSEVEQEQPADDAAADSEPYPKIEEHKRSIAKAPAKEVSARLRKGALGDLVTEHLGARPDEALTPSAIGKALGRSSGAVANALEKMVADGSATRVSDKPKRYAAATPVSGPDDLDADDDEWYGMAQLRE